jgi:hypothetical protein
MADWKFTGVQKEAAGFSERLVTLYDSVLSHKGISGSKDFISVVNFHLRHEFRFVNEMGNALIVERADISSVKSLNGRAMVSVPWKITVVLTAKWSELQ